MWSRFKTLDPWLFVLPLMLMGLSVLMVYSLDPSSNLYIHQAVYALLGIGCLGVAAFVDYRGAKAWAPWIYGIGLLGLVAVRLVGVTNFGAKLWINVGFFQFEPGELMKLFTAILLAALLGSRRAAPGAGRFLLILAVGLVPVIAIIAQPDLGTALIVLAIVIGILVHAGLSRWQKLVVVASLMVGILLFGLSLANVPPFGHILKPYQKDRLTSFIHPQNDPSGSGYNVLQSVIAVGSGGLTGKGLGNGSQSQLNFLPVAYADFIFAVIAETWGLVGSLLVLGLYAFLVLRILQAARIAKDQFGALLCIAVATKIIFEVLVNIGMNVRLMPVTGIPLPFLSYGGTTMLTNALCVGLVQSIVLRYKRLTF
jgi:rod shape determining protein RodA